MGSPRRGQTPLDWTQSDARFRALLHHSSDIITVLAGDGTVLYNTPAVERVLGYPPEELSGRVALEFIHPDDLLVVSESIQSALESPGTAIPVSFRFLHRDGRWIPCEAVGINYLDDESVRGIVVNSRDVTERLRAEQTYRTLVDHSLQGLAVIQHGQIVFANQALADITGYSVDDLLALQPGELRDLAHPNDLERLRAQWRARREGVDIPPRAEFRVVRKDGTVRSVETYSTTIEHRGLPATHVAYIDITERRRADAQNAALLEIARDLTETFDRHAIIARLLERTADLIPVDHLLVASMDAESGAYRPVAWLGTPPPWADALSFPLDHPLVAQLSSDNPIAINDAEQDLALDAGLGVRAALVSALGVRDRASGALIALRSRNATAFSDGDVRLFNGLAHQLALGLDVARRREAEQEDAAVDAALAAVAREMIASLSRPDLLSRLCEATTIALGCTRCHTFILDPRERHFVPTASHGFTQEQWEALQVFRFPEDLARDLLEHLRVEDARPVYSSDSMYPGPLLALAGTPAVLFMALRRGDAIMGLHSAGVTTPETRFSSIQIRIACGISQLASLSIEDARLVSELDRANRLKSEFVATMSHELRTPLNIILGYTDLLLEDAFGPLGVEQRDTLGRVGNNARSLLELINTTLDMSRLEAGEVRLDLREVAVAELIADIESEIREMLQKSSVSFLVDCPADLPPLRTDVAKVKVVLKNLIGNAIKFTERGSITLSASVRNAGIELRVADTGIGIDAESLAIIFEPFRQVDAALTRRHGGVGLGLYIVRRLLSELRGSIDVESTPGEGSIFRVWLPA